jgi:hypothetical protein
LFSPIQMGIAAMLNKATARLHLDEFRQRVSPVSQSRPGVSLSMRAAMGLAAVYLMVDKPELNQSLLVTGGAVAAGTVLGLLNTGASRQLFVSRVVGSEQ